MRILTTRLVFAQVLDALTLAYFWLVIGVGQHQEQNPFINLMLTLGGIQLFLLVKIGIVLLVAYRAEHPSTVVRWWSKPITSPRYIWVQTFMLSLATASGIVGAGFNMASIINAQTGFLFRF